MPNKKTTTVCVPQETLDKAEALSRVLTVVPGQITSRSVVFAAAIDDAHKRLVEDKERPVINPFEQTYGS